MITLAVGACSSSDTSAPAPENTNPPITYPTVPFSRLDDELRTRVTQTGAPGATLVVVQDDGVLHRFETGTNALDTPVPITDAGGLLTSLVILRLVDAGTLGLDDEVATTLPTWREVLRGTTVRDLLGHTSTLPLELDCTADGCDPALVAASARPTDGPTFRITPVDAHVLVRLAETVTEQPWPQLVQRELTDVLGLSATTFVVPDDVEAARRTLLGTDAVSTPAEFGRVLALVLARGTGTDGERVLTQASVAALMADHTDQLDTHLEPWVAWTGVPTFGLGVWRDRLRGDGSAAQVSIAGRNGFVGWVDLTRNAWGVLAIDQPANPGDLGAAVRASTAMVQGPMQPAIDTEGRPLRQPGSAVIGPDGQPLRPDP
jgi:CubicO group peptidase (beta-lactamase class C family)